MLVNKKKKEESIELLLSNLESHAKRESDRLSLIKEKDGNPLACIRGCGNFYEFKASYSLLLDKDVWIVNTKSDNFLKGISFKFYRRHIS